MWPLGGRSFPAGIFIALMAGALAACKSTPITLPVPNADALRTALIGHAIDYPYGAESIFQADGIYRYCYGLCSRGRWRISDGKFCVDYATHTSLCFKVYNDKDYLLINQTGARVSVTLAKPPDDWLVGLWIGKIPGLQGNNGSKRLLNIEVGEGGSEIASWAVTSLGAFKHTKLQVGAGAVHIVTSAGSRVELSRMENRLTGQFILASGEAYPITLHRVPYHWLIGKWDGEILGFHGKNGTRRVLNVVAVDTDGTATGAWTLTGKGGFTNTKVRVDKNAVIVTTSKGSHVHLKRESDILMGGFTLENGASYPVRLQRR